MRRDFLLQCNRSRSFCLYLSCIRIFPLDIPRRVFGGFFFFILYTRIYFYFFLLPLCPLDFRMCTRRGFPPIVCPVPANDGNHYPFYTPSYHIKHCLTYKRKINVSLLGRHHLRCAPPYRWCLVAPPGSTFYDRRRRRAVSRPSLRHRW